MMVAAQVIGNDATVAFSGTQGNLQLNVMMPVMARNLLESARLLANAARLLADKVRRRRRGRRRAHAGVRRVLPLDRHAAEQVPRLRGGGGRREAVAEGAAHDPRRGGRARPRPRRPPHRGAARRGPRRPRDGPRRPLKGEPEARTRGASVSRPACRAVDPNRRDLIEPRFLSDSGDTFRGRVIAPPVTPPGPTRRCPRTEEHLMIGSRRLLTLVTIGAACAMALSGCVSSGGGGSAPPSGGSGGTGWATATSAQAGGGMDALVAEAKKEGTLNVIALPPDWANYGAILEGVHRQVRHQDQLGQPRRVQPGRDQRRQAARHPGPRA